MKRIINIFSCVAAFAGMAAGLSSCYPEYHQRGQWLEPDDGPGREVTNPDKSSHDIELYYGYGDFYGTWYTDETDNYLVYLYEGETDEDGYFTNSATMLTLDILVPRKGFGKLPSATYLCNDNGANYTFIPSYNDKDEEGNLFLNGSTLYVQKTPDKYAYYSITGGSLNISYKVTGQYEISADIETENGQYKFHFKGAIDLEDKTQGGGEVDPVDPVDPADRPAFPAPEGAEWKARAQYNGACVDNADVDEFTLYLSKGDYAANGLDFVSSGSEIAIEVLTGKSDGKSIPSGTYSCTSDDPQPFRFYDGFVDENGEMYPSFFFRQYSTKEGDYSLEKITSGTLTVQRSGNDYALSFAFNCSSDGYHPNGYKVNYNGLVPFSKAPGLSSSASAKSVRAMAKGRAVPSVHRESARNKVTR